ncbi:MAG: hypothetical protein A2161_04635 [Candidatus Schekmanbacteria bacterium RBG_13_48_7]|uniref:Ribbon-helix-helix protein CopG domain-containing protein n=1 Tax=Candidatus Schekmanbacteria bacterium RBG_13_48_7 TaxID=1817878 RepID=A0A1F7RQ08_9BACT|nr:MAG: hypothetical protein A2161_04635 [Candidatus Schekmanbacteria bacterium RBG_13_48_7]
MYKTTTLRLPEKLLKEINKFVEDGNLDRSSYLREIILKGFEVDKCERILAQYETGKLSLEEASQKLQVDIWKFLQILKDSNRNLNVSLEDLLGSSD